MPRQRMVKPEFFDSESLALCSIEARLAFIGLWVTSDDYGNQKAQFSRLKQRIFPYDNIAVLDFHDMLCELEEVGCIKGYEVDGDRYITIPNFATYQTVRKPSKTSVPEPPKSTVKARTTNLVRKWRTSGAPVANDCVTSDGVQHQYATSDPERKKEGKKEVVVLQQQPPKERASGGAAVEKSTPPSAPICPKHGTALKRTGIGGDCEWWCDECMDGYPEVIA